MYCIKTAGKKWKKKSTCHGSPPNLDGPEDRNKVPYRVQCIRQRGNNKEEEAMSIAELCLPSRISQPYSLLTSLPKRDDLIQSTQTSNRFLQLKHMFT